MTASRSVFFVDALADGFVGLYCMAELNRAAFSRLCEMPLDFDTVDLGAGSPFGLERLLVAMILRESGAMGDILRRLGTRESFAREGLARYPGGGVKIP